MDESAVYLDRIVQDPAILGGRPAVKGTRIPVEVVLEYLASNPDFGELFTDYPRLTLDDDKACFAFSLLLAVMTPKDLEAATLFPASSPRSTNILW